MQGNEDGGRCGPGYDPYVLYDSVDGQEWDGERMLCLNLCA